MSIFEQKTAGVPLLFPSLDFLKTIDSRLSEMYFGGMPRRIIGGGYLMDDESLKLADFYQWEEVLLFNSREELYKLIDIIDFKAFSKRSLKENEKIKLETYDKWKNILNNINNTPTNGITTPANFKELYEQSHGSTPYEAVFSLETGWFTPPEHVQSPPAPTSTNTETKAENITFGVLTSEENFGKGFGAKGILNTWGKNLKNIYFATDGENPDERFIQLTKHRDLASNCEKQLKILIHIVEKYPKTEWYALVDDDTYMYADNLVEFLKGKETLDPVCYGYMMCLWPGDPDLIHPSGGAGYILNKTAAKLLSWALQNKKSLKTHTHWKTDQFDTIHPDKDVNRTTHPVNCGFGDATIGLYCRELNIEMIHCDKFHSRQPWGIDEQKRQGIEFLKKTNARHESFDRNISFHTITEQEMYNENWEKIEYINTNQDYNNI